MGTASQRLVDGDVRFHLGMKSDTDPSSVPPGYYFSAINMVCQGGVLQTRPGYKCKVTLPDGNLQGAALFRPLVGLEQIVVVVEGQVYVASWPFLEFRLLTNVLLSPYAGQVYFSLTTQTQERRTDDLDSAIDFIDPRRVMLIRDRKSATVWYDGSQSGQQRDDPYGIPVGGPMLWVGNRLWAATGADMVASDIGNPFSFRERLYPGGVSSMSYSSEITAMAETPGVTNPNLIVFTEVETNLVQANIRSRALWEQTPNFNITIFPIGTYSQRSVVSQNGSLYWWSPRGLLSFDASIASNNSSAIPLKDNEMLWSKVDISGDQTRVAGAAFNTFLLMSVPHGDLYNTHTMVLDSRQTPEGVTPWQGVWTGTRPVEWISGPIAGQERIFYVSKDYDMKNRLWEAFSEERNDNGCPISWAFETRGYFGPLTSGDYPSLADKTICYFETQLAEMDENVDLAAWWAGAGRGEYKRCLTKRIHAENGSLRFDLTIDESTLVFGYKPQGRRVKTADVREDPAVTLTSCGVERDETEIRDDAFQYLIAGSGACAFRWIRIFAMPQPQDLSGLCEENESAEYGVRFDGAAAKENTAKGVFNRLEEGIVVYESLQTVTLEQDGVSVSGSGVATSIISQEDADKIAARIATRQAEVLLEALLPKIISDGHSFDPSNI